MNEDDDGIFKKKKSNEPQTLAYQISNQTPKISFQKYNINRRMSSAIQDRFLSNERTPQAHHISNNNTSFSNTTRNNKYKTLDNAFYDFPITINNFANTFSFNFHGAFTSTFKTPKKGNYMNYNRNISLPKPVIIETVLDAPSVVDEYPSQLVDISNDNSIIVALGSSVYLWQNGDVKEILESVNNINSVCWAGDNSNVIISAQGQVELWDVNKCEIVRSFCPHNGIVGTIDVSHLGNRIATGGCDSVINISDIRSTISEPYYGNYGEVSAVKWSPDGTTLASSSHIIYDNNEGNSGDDSNRSYTKYESKVKIWNNNSVKTIFKSTYSQNTPIKSGVITSLAWQSYQVLITGDDSEQGIVNYIPVLSTNDYKYFSTNSPVSSISWNKKWGLAIAHKGNCENNNTNENYHSCNWEIRNNDFKRIASVGGSNGNIINIVSNYDDSMIVTISSDESLRKYDIYDSHSKSKMKKPSDDSFQMFVR